MGEIPRGHWSFDNVLLSFLSSFAAISIIPVNDEKPSPQVPRSRKLLQKDGMGARCTGATSESYTREITTRVTSGCKHSADIYTKEARGKYMGATHALRMLITGTDSEVFNCKVGPVW